MGPYDPGINTTGKGDEGRVPEPRPTPVNLLVTIVVPAIVYFGIIDAMAAMPSPQARAIYLRPLFSNGTSYDASASGKGENKGRLGENG